MIRDEVFDPMNIEHSYFVWNDYLEKHKAVGHKNNKPSGGLHPLRAHMAGTLHSEAKEYAKFVTTLMKEIDIENSTFQKMSAPQISVEIPPELNFDPVPTVSMCLGVMSWESPLV